MGVSIVMGGTPIAGWFIRETPIKLDAIGVPPFQEPSYNEDILGDILRR
jgi:hypothetical protein